jgi:hypothetical protein
MSSSTGLLLVLCAAAMCVSATYNGSCARRLAWAPTPGQTSDTLEVGWPDGVPAVLVLANATSNHYVRITGRYNRNKAAPGPVAQETHKCVPLGTNKTLMVPNADASARIRLDPATNNTLVEPLPGTLSLSLPFLLFFFFFKRNKKKKRKGSLSL